MSSRNLYENNSGCFDPVAGDVIGRIDTAAKRAKKKNNRVGKLSRALHDIADLAGFRIKGTIIIEDKHTGESFNI